MFIISSSAFIALPRRGGRSWRTVPRGRARHRLGRWQNALDGGDFVAVGGEFWWPSVGKSVATYGEFLMAAERRQQRQTSRTCLVHYGELMETSMCISASYLLPIPKTP